MAKIVIRLLKDFRIEGARFAAGLTIAFPEELAQGLVDRELAAPADSPRLAGPFTDSRDLWP
jgi:hypothetical protein